MASYDENVVIIEWKPNAKGQRGKKIWIYYASLQTASKITWKPRGQIWNTLKTEGKYEDEFVIVYSVEQAEREGKSWDYFQKSVRR